MPKFEYRHAVKNGLVKATYDEDVPTQSDTVPANKIAVRSEAELSLTTLERSGTDRSPKYVDPTTCSIRGS